MPSTGFRPKRFPMRPEEYALDVRIRHIEDELTNMGGSAVNANTLVNSGSFGNNAAASAGQTVTVSGGGGGGGGGGGSSLLSGDVTGPSLTNTVSKLQGTTLSLSSLVTGQLLSFNGTAIVNTSTITGPLTVTGLLTAGEITTGAFFDVKSTGEIDVNGSAGTVGQILTSNGPGVSASWATGGSDTDSLATLTDVSLSGTAQGDVLYRGATVWNNLPAGTAGFVLTTNGPGANPSWTATGAGTLAGLGDVTLSGVAQGDMLYRGATKWNNLPAGTSGQFLQTQGAAANPIWATLPADTDSLATLTDVSLSGTAQGDILYRGATQWNNLPHGTTGQVLTTNGAAANPSWTTPAGTDTDTYTGASGSEPGSPNTGDLYFPNNGFIIERYSGTAWVPWGPSFPFVAPNDSLYSWVNQGSASVSTTNGGIFLSCPAGAGSDSLNIRVKTVPTAPYTMTMAFLPRLAFPADFNACGLVLRDSVSGKLVTLHLVSDTNKNATDILIGAIKWNSPTSFNAFYTLTPTVTASNYAYASPWTCGACMFLQIQDDNTNRILSVSNDGQRWFPLFSVSRTDFITPDQIGFFVNCYNSTFGVGMNALSLTGG